ncbi:MAG: RidA family protein [Thermoplasmata archaeon]
MNERPSERLAALGLTLPPPPQPAGSYAPLVVHRDLAWVSGQIVTQDKKVVSPGKVDADVPFDTAQQLARRATLQALSALSNGLGSIDRVQRILRVGVYVASSPGFVRQHEVGNGATDLLIAVFGESGRPARASVGVPSLPLDAPVEIELWAALA